MAWGVGFLLLLVGLGEGFRSGNKRKLAQYGIIFIFPGRAPVVRGSRNSACKYLLTYQDYLDIRREAPHVRNASPSSLGSAQKEKARPVAVPDFLKVLSYVSIISQPERINCDMFPEISAPCYEQLNLRAY